MDPLFRWISLGVFLVTCPFWLIGLWEARDVHEQLSRGQQTLGTVIGNRSTVDQRDGAEEHSFQPEVSFRSSDGHVHHFTDGVGSLPPDFAVGDSVTVLYTPATPESARIVSWKRLWFVPTLLIFVGLLPGILVWLVLAKVSRASDPRAG